MVRRQRGRDRLRDCLFAARRIELPEREAGKPLDGRGQLEKTTLPGESILVSNRRDHGDLREYGRPAGRPVGNRTAPHRARQTER